MRPPHSALASRRPARPGGRRSTGQSLVEFALILPVMLTLLGGAVDFARVYRGWIDLQAATRSAAEYVATTPNLASPQTAATTMICAQVTGSPSCASVTVTATLSLDTSTGSGASTTYPIGRATVTASMPFRMLFSYPFLTKNGAWTISATESFSVVQGRL